MHDSISFMNMENLKSTCIRYHIPKFDGFSVAIPKRKSLPAFNSIKDFLDTHTIYKWESKIEYYFTCPEKLLETSKGKDLINEIGIAKKYVAGTLTDGTIVAHQWSY